MLHAYRDAAPVLALVVLLVVAYLHPRGRVEAVAGIAGAALALSTGALDLGATLEALDRLLPVVVFLLAILVVAEACRGEGLFSAIGARLALRGDPRRLLGLSVVVAAATTVALSLDATVVLFTPVVVAAAAAARAPSRPAELACVRMANSASLLLPVSNLTNLLALPDLHLSFGAFLLRMAPSWVVVVAIEYVALRLVCHRDLVGRPRGARVPAGALPPLPWVPVLAIGLMLCAFGVTSILGVAPAWTAVAAALALSAHVLSRRRATLGHLARSAHVSFGIFVLGLGVVVAVLTRTWLGAVVRDLVPSGEGLPALLGVALLGAVLANVVNNLPATLLAAPMVGPLGATAVLALLVGINVGSSLTWTGSLANLLWRRSLTRHGGTSTGRDFHLMALVASPAGIVAGVAVLFAWSGFLG
ncbi:MAG TPA: SLC13 family permease [Marmoricola sp.]|nr:SLC13 family permease [Marmoricola sp.]